MKKTITEQMALRKIRRMIKKFNPSFSVHKARGDFGHVFVCDERKHLVDEDISAIKLLARLLTRPDLRRFAAQHARSAFENVMCLLLRSRKACKIIYEAAPY